MIGVRTGKMIWGRDVLRLILRQSPQLSDIITIRRCLSGVQATGQEVNRFAERSHNCGQITRDHIGERVNLYGWVQYTRFDNKIIALRDSYGTVQCIVGKDQLTKAFRKTAIQNESVLKISGTVRARPQDQVRETELLGSVEIAADNVAILSDASKNLPILVRESDPEHTLVNKLKYRYLDIRSGKMQEALRFRSEVCRILRQKLYDLRFVECETPTLFKRTPGGANEFIVPTRDTDMFYSLTQSPQQLKQLLMIGGLDRYFQICRCYRDESGRADRQPEFTQLDIELSFTNQDLIIEMIDELMNHLFKSLCADTENLFDNNGRVPRIDFKDSFLRYGCDKPDTRFGWLIQDFGEGDLGIEVPHSLQETTISRMLDAIKTSQNLDTTQYQVKVKPSDGRSKNRITINSRSDEARRILGQLRLAIASTLVEHEQIYSSRFKLVWVTGFPLFEYDQETRKFESSHHPFTAPTTETEHLLKTKPQDVIGQHYDLVLNGQEVAGGSIRIHDADLQQYIFRDIMRLDDDQTFRYFVDALRSGCPPHGGIAIGLDRLIAILLSRDSIRDVIAFPKSNVGRDLMSGCPHALDEQTRKLYHV